MFKGLVMLVLKALNGVFLTSKADSFLKFFFYLGIVDLDGSLRRREEEIGIDVINLVKRPPLSVL